MINGLPLCEYIARGGNFEFFAGGFVQMRPRGFVETGLARRAKT